MEVIVLWAAFSLIVAIAAGARGRNGAAWFILAIAISPLLALIFVLVIPNLAAEKKAKELAAIDRKLRRAPIGGRFDRVTVDRGEKPFEPDGVLGGFPYRVAEDGSILAIMQGAKVKFGDMERFIAAVDQ